MYVPTLADRIAGSVALRRRQALGRAIAGGLARAAKAGVGYFALRGGAVVLPVACHGTDAMTHRNSLRRPTARMIFGDPIAVERYPIDRPLNRRLVAQTTEQIRVALADLVADTPQRRQLRKAAA